MTAALSAEERIRNGALEVGCSVHKLADYVGVGKSALADQLSSGRLPSPTAERVLEVLEVMRTIQGEVKLPVDWTQSSRIKPILEQRIERYREEKDPMPRYFFVLKTSSINFFQTRRGGEIISTPTEARAAGFATFEIAQQAAAALKRLDANTRIEQLSNTVRRRQSTLTTDIADLGLMEF
jgi:hypothetical protein